jgi:GTP-binding protein EngB required for normal cell division
LLDRSASKKNKPATQPGQIDEQWVKDLQMFKKQTEEEKQLFLDILKHDAISTEVLIAKLDQVETLSENIHGLKKEMQDYYERYKWALEQEKRQ